MQTRNACYTSKNVTKPRKTTVTATVSKNSNVYNRKVAVNSISDRSLRFVAR